MTLEEAFLLACMRNAIRRESGLPLLVIRDAIEAELRAAQARAFSAAADRYHSDYLSIRRDVLARRRQNNPHFGLSAGSRWAVEYEARHRFDAFLATKGYRAPRGGVRYGDDLRGK